MDILIFETNINTPEDLRKVRQLLTAESRIKNWSVDMDDIDKILRVESINISSDSIENLLSDADFQCRSLHY
ncbi:hypothetical protein [Pedobacter antarcticus]|uniref:hypothetical protein n=1 Tax=Pedobacter antarcticus TaxID=34086 RepID=UPI001C59F73E|nr:hypothetical protein [Pedobacter antarcticus]